MPTATDARADTADIASFSSAQLRALLVEKDRLIADHQQPIAERDHALADSERRHKAKEKLVKLLEEQLRLAHQQRFGAKSEKQPFQGDFFDEAELEQALSDVEQDLAEAGAPPARQRQPRKGFSDRLPRIRVELTLSEEEKVGARRTFFAKVKEELNIVPAKAQVIEYWQEKAVFESAEGETLKSATRQPHPLGKCIASVSLLAYLLVAKYADALPLYRLEKILARYGGNISRTAMENWIIRLDDVFKPLINLLQEQQRSADYLQADETRIKEHLR